MDFQLLVSNIEELDTHLKKKVTASVNSSLSMRNWVIGWYLVEYEQNGAERAEYGAKLIPQLAKTLKIKGLSTTVLRHCRTFYLYYPSIHQSLTDVFPKSLLPIGWKHNLERNSSVKNFKKTLPTAIHQSLTGESSTGRKTGEIDKAILSQLSFTHIVELLKIEDPLKRAFYEIEAIKGRWSVRDLKRQTGSLLFERTGLSRDKKKLIELTNEGKTELAPSDIIRDPYIFEFLELRPTETMLESDLENALLNHLQSFLLELGRGFCLESRQRKILIGDEYYYIDLVFFHRILRCHVLIDLKVEPFSHENAGQLNTYLNWFKEHEMHPSDKPPIGILLCTDRKTSLAKYALGGMEENLFISQYELQLPSLEELEEFLTHEQSQYS